MSYEAFMPNEKTDRKDSCFDASVNWEDNSDVEAITLRDRSTAEFGAARFKVEDVNMIAARENVAGKFSAERRKIDGNPHHGNLVFDPKLSKGTRKAIANTLALFSSFVHPPTRS